jgi:hypothetical protein
MRNQGDDLQGRDRQNCNCTVKHMTKQTELSSSAFLLQAHEPENIKRFSLFHYSLMIACLQSSGVDRRKTVNFCQFIGGCNRHAAHDFEACLMRFICRWRHFPDWLVMRDAVAQCFDSAKARMDPLTDK